MEIFLADMELFANQLHAAIPMGINLNNFVWVPPNQRDYTQLHFYNSLNYFISLLCEQ